MPLFSIITCTRNSRTFLKECLDSVTAQEFEDYEHIFIDGKSTDGTIEMIEQYRKNRPDKIKLFSFEPKGITEAMNRGIENSSARYIIHLNSDDKFYNNHVLAKAARFLEKNINLDWSYGQTEMIDSGSRRLWLINRSPFKQFGSDNRIMKQILKYQNTICQQSVFVRKAVFDRFGLFNEANHDTSDYEYWLKIMNSTSWQFMGFPISSFRIHDAGNSTSPQNRLKLIVSTRLVQKKRLNPFEFYIVLPLFSLASAIYYSFRRIFDNVKTG